MQKIYTFLFLFSSVLAFSQCPSQTLYFNTQEDVDAFKIDYPNCTTLDHDLVLMNNMGSIENLDALSNLTAVNGTLTFQFFDGTINIDGLNNLERISGSLLISNITVDQFIGFKSIVSIGEGLKYTYNTNNEVSILDNLESVGGDFIFSSTGDAEVLNSINALQTIGGNVDIAYTRIPEFSGFSSIKEIEGSLQFRQNESHLIKGFDELVRLGGNLTIENSTQLNDVQGFDKLATVEGDLTISDCENLVNFDGFISLSQLGGNLHISYNHALSSLSAFETIQSILGSVRIMHNRSEKIEGFENLENVEGNLEFEGNGVAILGFNKLQSIGGYLSFEDNRTLEQVVGFEEIETIGDGLSFYKNEELLRIEGFNNLRKIEGNLSFMYNSKLNSLSQFEQLESIQGEFMLFLHALENIDGFNALTLGVSNLSIRSGYNLRAVDGFDKLQEVSGDFRIWDNEFLMGLSGFNQLRILRGGLEIENNPVLKTIKGFRTINTIEGNLGLSQNALEDISGFDNLVHLGSMSIGYNTGVINLGGLNNLEGYMGDFSTYKVRISELSGFNKLTSIRWIRINNTSIQKFTGFEALEEIEVSFEMSYSHINEFKGFSNLTVIGENLDININEGFERIEGFQNLKSIGDRFYLGNNKNLDYIGSLDNIEEVGSSIGIYNNPNLSTCNLKIICEFLEEDKIISFSYNKEGCSSKEEVLEQCRSGLSIEDPDLISLSFYPNPTSDFLNIQYPNELPEKIEVFDLSGRYIKEVESNNTIDLSSLNTGIYLIRLIFEHTVVTKKINKA